MRMAGDMMGAEAADALRQLYRQIFASDDAYTAAKLELLWYRHTLR